MRRILPDVKEHVLKRVLEGDTYRKVANECPISPASIYEIVQDAKKKQPDLDSLIILSTILRKNSLNIFDAERGCKLLERLNQIGVSSRDLENYVESTERMLSENNPGEDFIAYALKLMQLEQTCGRPYKEIVEDYEQKIHENAELDNEKATLENKIDGLEADVKAAEGDLRTLKAETERITRLNKGITEIGSKRLASLVKFIQDFESLEFSADEVQRLAGWKITLLKTGIDPGTLASCIEKRGELHALNSDLELRNMRFKAENQEYTSCGEQLLQRNHILLLLDQAMKTKTWSVMCRSCRAPIPVQLRSAERYDSMIRDNVGVRVRCWSCGSFQVYSPFDIAASIAWLILPSEVAIPP